MVSIRGFLLAALALSGVSCASAPRPAPAVPAGENVVAFVGATVVPMDEERLLPDHTVVIANGRIVALGPSAEVEVPRGATRIDARGRYLLPALCDMHVHLLGEAWTMMLPPEQRQANADLPFDEFLFPYVAKGVTTVQALSATPEEVELRGRIERGELLGPRLVLGRMIDGPGKAWPPPLATWVATPAEASEAVRQAKAQGYDKIKVYSFLSRESYDAIVATAREVGMDVIGHIPMALSLDYVLDSGQVLIAHSEELHKHTGGDVSAAQVDAMAAKMAERGVWMIPTLITTQSILELLDHPDTLLGRPETVYYRHPLEQGVWSFVTENLYRPIPEAGRQSIREGYDFQRPLTRALQEKGGRLLAGSDTILPGLVPGFALHRELQEMVAAGLTPYQALRAATAAPFEYLGESERAGTIAVGKESDLLLVEANPLEDIAAASKVAGVWVRGRWLDAGEIAERMRALAAAPAAAPSPAASSTPATP